MSTEAEVVEIYTDARPFEPGEIELATTTVERVGELLAALESGVARA